MKIRVWLFILTLLPVLLGLSACGGGSGSGIIPPPPPPPPPPPSALPEGELIAFGPLATSGGFKIAGVDFGLGATTVMVNGQPGALATLQPGHLVAMVGDTDANERTTARELIFEANMIGNVDSVDTAANTLVVMGQPIRVTTASILTTALQNFSPGEVVQVSGYGHDDGVTVASRIDYSVSNRELRLVGTVQSLDAANFRFEINNLNVDYSQAQMIDTPSGDVEPGMEVLVTGGRSINGTFNVQTLEFFDRDVSELSGAHFRAEGQITAARAGDDFSVNGFSMLMGGQRDYRQGSADDIVVGAQVRVEGNVLNDATAQAHRVWFLRP